MILKKIFGLVIIEVIVGVLIARDASSRGMNGFRWGIFAFFVPIIAILIYLVVRKPRNIDVWYPKIGGRNAAKSPPRYSDRG